jgi:hypothetical protein
MQPSASRPLKLRARDRGDLEVISALLQDALVPLVDVTYLPREKRFVLVGNRFRWPEAERVDGPPAPRPPPPGEDASFADAVESPPFERVNCGLCFDRVIGVRSTGIDRHDREQILNLLAIESENGTVTLVFSGGGAIRLEVSGLLCHMEDLGEAWPTRWRPTHDDRSEASS